MLQETIYFGCSDSVLTCNPSTTLYADELRIFGPISLRDDLLRNTWLHNLKYVYLSGIIKCSAPFSHMHLKKLDMNAVSKIIMKSGGVFISDSDIQNLEFKNMSIEGCGMLLDKCNIGSMIVKDVIMEDNITIFGNDIKIKSLHHEFLYARVDIIRGILRVNVKCEVLILKCPEHYLHLDNLSSSRFEVKKFSNVITNFIEYNPDVVSVGSKYIPNPMYSGHSVIVLRQYGVPSDEYYATSLQVLKSLII